MNLLIETGNKWARARTLHSLYLEHTTSSSSQHIPLTIGDVYAWLEDMSLFPRPAASVRRLPDVKKKAKEKEKEGTPMVGDIPCPICGTKKRLHPGYESKSEDSLWTCSVVPWPDQSRLTRLPFINLISMIASSDELERALYNPPFRTQPGDVAPTIQAPPYSLPTLGYSPRDLVTLSPPDLILAVHKTISDLQLPHFPRGALKGNRSRFLDSKEAVEQGRAPAALLAASLKPFVSTLIRLALDVAKHDLLVVTSANTSAATGKSGRASRSKKVPFVLTPSHVLRGVKSSFIQRRAAPEVQYVRNITPKEAVGLCLARTGLPCEFGYTVSLEAGTAEHITMKAELEA